MSDLESTNALIQDTTPSPDALTAEQMKMLDDSHEGNVNQKAEMRISRVALTQALTPEVAQKLAGYTDGQFIDSLNRSILSTFDKPIWLTEEGTPADELKKMHYMAFIPVQKLPTEYIHWIKRSDRLDGDPPYIFKTTDESDPRVREGVWPNRNGTWGTKPEQKGKAPPVTDNINYLVLPFDYSTKTALGGFYVLTFSRTSVNAGKSLTTRLAELKTMANIRPYQSIFFLFSKSLTVGKDTFNIMQVSQGKKLASQVVPFLSQMALAQALYLADTVLGKSRQATILQTEVEDDGKSSTDHSHDGAVNAAGSGASTEVDPFAKPDSAEGEPEF